jgi:hypothetical protein
VRVPHTELHDLAVRLLRGEIVERRDEHGRLWRATHDSLSIVLPGSAASGPVLDGVDAYDVAWLLFSWTR